VKKRTIAATFTFLSLALLMLGFWNQPLTVKAGSGAPAAAVVAYAAEDDTCGNEPFPFFRHRGVIVDPTDVYRGDETIRDKNGSLLGSKSGPIGVYSKKAAFTKYSKGLVLYVDKLQPQDYINLHPAQGTPTPEPAVFNITSFGIPLPEPAIEPYTYRLLRGTATPASAISFFRTNDGRDGCRFIHPDALNQIYGMNVAVPAGTSVTVVANGKTVLSTNLYSPLAFQAGVVQPGSNSAAAMLLATSR